MALPSPSGGGGLRWLEVLEGEFDGLFRELHHGLGLQPASAEEERALWAGARSRVNGLASVFAQMSKKCRAVFETNLKLEAMLLAAQSELLQAKTESGELGREVRARTLQVRSLELQLSQAAGKERPGGQELSTLRAQLELEVERYHQSPDSEERLLATIVQLQQESTLLHEYIQTLLDDLAEKSLSVAYLQKELAGRVQQLQLIANGVRGRELEKFWLHIHTEVSLQKNKSLLMAYRGTRKDSKLLSELREERERAGELREKVLELSSHGQQVRQATTEGRRVRWVTLAKEEGQSLGLSITGGVEHGTPILISDIEEGKTAYKCGQLKIGDAILSVNGQSLTGFPHQDVVALMRATDKSVTLEVAFVIGAEESPHGDGTGKALVSDRGLHVPPNLEDGFVSPATNGDPEAPSRSAVGLSQSESQTLQSGSEHHDGQVVKSEQRVPPQELEISAAEKLASAFALTPSPVPFSTSDVDLFWYKEAEGESPGTPGVPRSQASGHHHFFVTAHGVPYSIFPSPAAVEEGERETSTPRQEGVVRKESWKDEPVVMRTGEAINGGPPPHDTATPPVNEGANSGKAPSQASQDEERTQVQTPTEAQVSTPSAHARTFQMTVATVPIQSLPYVDTDDIPLFSI